jgi:hypothetical protein
MHNQRLWGPPLDGPAAVVRHFGAMQAQEFAVARWSIAQRAGGRDAAGIDRLIADGTIVRTHILRPTWHFVLAEDMPWLIGLSAPRVHAVNRHYYHQFGLPADLLARTDDLLRAWLAGGEHLTRKEVAARLAAEGIAASGLQLGYMLMHAELEAILCSGAPRGKQQTYAAFDRRVPPAAPWERDRALAELTRRYFTAHGPATVRDFAWWSGLTIADCRRGLELAAAHLRDEVVDGRSYWSAPAPPGDSPPSPRVDLVQAYDEHIVAYSESKDVLALPPVLLPSRRRGDGTIPTPYLHALLLDGRVIGHWRPTLKRTAVEIATQLYRPISDPERAALAAAAARYARFVGVPACLA